MWWKFSSSHPSINHLTKCAWSFVRFQTYSISVSLHWLTFHFAWHNVNNTKLSGCILVFHWQMLIPIGISCPDPFILLADTHHCRQLSLKFREVFVVKVAGKSVTEPRLLQQQDFDSFFSLRLDYHWPLIMLNSTSHHGFSTCHCSSVKMFGGRQCLNYCPKSL